jgi:hypothetical protein
MDITSCSAFCDSARHVRADGDLVHLHIGVLGAHVARRSDVVIGAGRDDQERAEAKQQAAT